MVTAWLFGGGPGLNFDFATFSFQAPVWGSSAARRPTETMSVIRASVIVLAFIFSSPFVYKTVTKIPPILAPRCNARSQVKQIWRGRRSERIRHGAEAASRAKTLPYGATIIGR